MPKINLLSSNSWDIDDGINMNAYQNLVDKHLLVHQDKCTEAFVRHARNRGQFFLKHGERFDRRLYSDICSIVRIYNNFIDFGIITGNSEQIKELLKIQDDMLMAGKQVYKNFP